MLAASFTTITLQAHICKQTTEKNFKIRVYSNIRAIFENELQIKREK